MKRSAILFAVSALFALTLSAQTTTQAIPFEYDPGNACDIQAVWQNGTIVLQKNCPTATDAAAGVDIISPLEGQDVSLLTNLSFDYQNGGHCGAGAPRFNVVIAGTTYFLGCSGGVQTDLGNGWTRVTFGPTEFAAAGMPATGTIDDISIIFDEGSDTPAGGTIGTPGQVVIDNITVNGDVIGESAHPTDMNQCKNGGWMNFQDPSFRNQGQCVSYVVSHRGGNGGANHGTTKKRGTRH